MAEEKFERAKKVFNTTCETLKANDWKFTTDEEDLIVRCSARGEDLPMDILIRINADRQLISLFSCMPFRIQESKRLDLAIAISIINNRLVDGSFDFNINDGSVIFRLTSSFIESEISGELIYYMLMVSCFTIDEYNDKLLMLDKGMLSLEEFISSK